MKVAVIGLGSFGRAMGYCAVRAGSEVTFFSRSKNKKDYLTQDKLLSKCKFELYEDYADVSKFDIIVISVVSQAFRKTCLWLNKSLSSKNVVLSTTKGMEEGTLLFTYEIMSEIFKNNVSFGILSGPNFAKELIENLPSGAVTAASSKNSIDIIQKALGSKNFRIYSSTDIIGLSVSGSLKNVVALIAGICDGLNLGNNATAAMVTRGFAEIVEIGIALGADLRTFIGLSGMGDLVLTATSNLSRNRRFGIKVAQGDSIDNVIKDIEEVVESYVNTKNAYFLSKKLNIYTPLIKTAYRVLYKKLSVDHAFKILLKNDPQEEFAWIKYDRKK